MTNEEFEERLDKGQGMKENTIIQGDSLTILKTLPDECISCCITSPPYWGLRDYGVEGQLGLEKTPEEYVEKMVEVFREVKRVLKKEGVCWLNLGDSYATQHDTGTTDKAKGWTSATGIGGRQLEHGRSGSGGLPSKNLVGIPWRVAFALQADGWYLRQDIIWAKPNPMPESVTDRCTKSHEYVFLLSKSAKYYFDNEAIKEGASGRIPGNKNPQKGVGEKFGETKDGLLKAQNQQWDLRNKRSVWTVNTKPYSGAHFATFPEKLIVPMIKAGCIGGGIVLDCFSGAGTTCMVAKKLNRKYIGIELNPKYIELSEKRIETECGTLF